MTIQWRYTDETQAVVAAAFDDGHSESHLVTADCIQAWLAEGNTPLPYEPPIAEAKEQAKAELASSDKDMARIVEDLINIMVNDGLIKKEDLPAPVIAKLQNRANLRKVLQADDD